MLTVGTDQGTGAKMPKMTLDCVWELWPHNSSSGQAPQHHTYKPGIEVSSQTSPFALQVNALPWGGLRSGLTSWQEEVSRRYEEMGSL